ncbi:MAG: hypothetical protein KAR42_06710 [candidate division Zixibacteria bacterium]|nr:hypothetical protein [candidate division Zixibacteria bacterium]
MKKTAAFSTIFLVAFCLAIGLTVTFSEDAHAIKQCGWVCEMKVVRTMDTGPLCSGNTPYYAYRQSACLGGPLNCERVSYVFGCHDGDGGFIRIIRMLP